MGGYFNDMFVYAQNPLYGGGDIFVESIANKFILQFGMPQFVSNKLNDVLRQFFKQDPNARISAGVAANQLASIFTEVEHLVRLCGYMRRNHNQAGTRGYIPGAPGRKETRRIDMKKHTFKPNDETKGMSQSLDKIFVTAPLLRADIEKWQGRSKKTIGQVQNYYQ